MDTEPRWLNQLWDDLGALEPAERVRRSGDWITLLTHTLLPQLGEYRRAQVVHILAEQDWDPQRLAETIGARTETMRRLAREWRRDHA